MKKLYSLLLTSLILACSLLVGCKDTTESVETVSSAPTEATLTVAEETKENIEAVTEQPISQPQEIKRDEPIVVSELSEDEILLEYAFKAIDDIISSDVANGFSSAQMAVMLDGRLVYANSWGENVDNYTLYDLASNTKMYSVIYAVQLLVTQKKLDIDTKIVDILGNDFADDVIEITYRDKEAVSLETQREWKKSITIRNVLCHQAGFPDSIHYYDPGYDVASQKAVDGAVNVLYQGDNATREEVLKKIFETPLIKAPGGEPLYSDIDYMLMCFVLEKITGESLEEFVKENFYEPLNFNHISYKPLENGFLKEDIAPTEIHGNTRDGAVSFPGIRDYTLQGEVHDECAFYSMKGVSGHAGLFSNAVDLAKLCNLMIDGTGDGKVYFSDDVIDEFTSPLNSEYSGWGIGWWRHGENGQREYYFSKDSSYNTIGHQGWTGTLTMIDRDNKLVMVLLTNKLNTSIINPEENPNGFKGNSYTTAKLSFAAPLIYAALKASDEEEAQQNIDACLAKWREQ